MQYKKLTILGIIILVVLFITFGLPTEIKFVGTPPFIEIIWKTEPPTLQPPPIQQPPKIPEIKIDLLKTRQGIYQQGDTAYVDFEITNELNIPYNVTVDWLYNNTRYHGWFNVSTDVYYITIQKNYWSSWYSIQKPGDWEVHLVIKYSLLNKTFSKDGIVKFKVV